MAKAVATGYDLKSIFGEAEEQEQEQQQHRLPFISTEEKERAYKAGTVVLVWAVGERVNTRYKDPEYALEVSIGTDNDRKLLTVSKKNKRLVGTVEKILLALKSPASRDAQGHQVPVPMHLKRDESRQPSRPWSFVE